jgi:hypothetical protein
MRSSIRIPHLLFALLVAAFITLYPQLDGAGLCDGDGCPKVTYGAQGAGGAVSGAPGVSLVVAALVSISGAFLVRGAGAAILPAAPHVLIGIDAPPDVPPPRPSL